MKYSQIFLDQTQLIPTIPFIHLYICPYINYNLCLVLFKSFLYVHPFSKFYLSFLPKITLRIADTHFFDSFLREPLKWSDHNEWWNSTIMSVNKKKVRWDSHSILGNLRRDTSVLQKSSTLFIFKPYAGFLGGIEGLELFPTNMLGKVTFPHKSTNVQEQRLVIKIYLKFLRGPTQLFLISNLWVKCHLWHLFASSWHV